MPRVNIYLPASVKAAMDTVEQHRPNWSIVAQQAFVAEVARLGKLYGTTHKKRPRERRA